MRNPRVSQQPRAVGPERLERNAVGTLDLVFFVVAAAAPLTAMAGAAGLAIATGNGAGAPGAYALAGATLLLFAVGYAAMSRHVRNAGAFYAYIQQAFGRSAGLAAAFVALLAYNAIQISLYGLFGYFAASIFAEQFGISLAWEAWAFIAIAAVFALAYRSIAVSAKLLGLALGAEVLVLAVMALAIVAAGGDSGLGLSPLEPASVFSGAVGVAFVWAFGAFIGFEATAIYGEEARDPERTVARGTYVAVVFLATFYAFVVWALVNGFGTENVVAAAQEDAGGLFFAASDRYVGEFWSDAMSVLLVTSSFAALLAFHNAANRYLYALGREGVLPVALGRTHPVHRSPWVAGLSQTVLAALVVGIFALAGADPYLHLLSWLFGTGTVGLVLLQAVTSFSIVAFFRRHPELEEGLWRTAIAPLLGGLGLLGALALILTNFELLTGAGTEVNLLLTLPLVAVAAAGALRALYMRRRAPDRYERLASVRVFDESIGSPADRRPATVELDGEPVG